VLKYFNEGANKKTQGPVKIAGFSMGLTKKLIFFVVFLDVGPVGLYFM
jgi:hypothetical protein